jgi:MarR family transcriptional regulator, organic hydroperoxide resistance regulator
MSSGEPADGLVLDLQRATHAVGVSLESKLRELGLSQGEAHVLALLGGGTSHSVGELQRGLGHRPSTLSGILDRLEARGLLERSLNEADRRSFMIRLTRRGVGASAAVRSALDGLDRELGARVTAGELAGFRAVVRAWSGPGAGHQP